MRARKTCFLERRPFVLDDKLTDGQLALREGRFALSNYDFVAAQDSVAKTNAIDTTSAVLSVGIVDGEGLEHVTQQLRRQVERIDVKPVEVPAYEEMRVREATLVYWREVLVAWIGASLIDFLPLLMLTLVAVGVGEYRLREKYNVREPTIDDRRRLDDELESAKVLNFPAE